MACNSGDMELVGRLVVWAVRLAGASNAKVTDKAKNNFVFISNLV
jgi:hypothetical protein